MNPRRISALLMTATCLAVGVQYSGCAQMQTAATKAQSFANSPNGQVLLTGVSAAAQAFAPQYAGVIGQAIYSLETGKLPAASVIASTIASATGNHATDQKIAAIATAVLATAQAAPSPVAGLSAAAAQVNATAPPPAAPPKSAALRLADPKFRLGVDPREYDADDWFILDDPELLPALTWV